MSSYFQDDTRENMMRDLFELSEVSGRSETDATMSIDGKTLEFELKTTSDPNRSVTTVRDFGPDHIRKWKNKHWLIGFYEKGAQDPSYFMYGSPRMMSNWIEEKWDYIKPDFLSAEIVSEKLELQDMFKILGEKDKYCFEDAVSLQKKQYKKSEYFDLMDLDGGYSPEKMLEIYRQRISYLISRGSTLNNPHIPGSYFKNWSTKIVSDHARTLRDLARGKMS